VKLVSRPCAPCHQVMALLASHIMPRTTIDLDGSVLEGLRRLSRFAGIEVRDPLG
jgi:hypothetical protein